MEWHWYYWIPIGAFLAGCLLALYTVLGKKKPRPARTPAADIAAAGTEAGAPAAAIVQPAAPRRSRLKRWGTDRWKFWLGLLAIGTLLWVAYWQRDLVIVFFETNLQKSIQLLLPLAILCLAVGIALVGYALWVLNKELFKVVAILGTAALAFLLADRLGIKHLIEWWHRDPPVVINFKTATTLPEAPPARACGHTDIVVGAEPGPEIPLTNGNCRRISWHIVQGGAVTVYDRDGNTLLKHNTPDDLDHLLRWKSPPARFSSVDGTPVYLSVDTASGWW